VGWEVGFGAEQSDSWLSWLSSLTGSKPWMRPALNLSEEVSSGWQCTELWSLHW